jgi:hypothetical protein
MWLSTYQRRFPHPIYNSPFYAVSSIFLLFHFSIPNLCQYWREVMNLKSILTMNDLLNYGSLICTFSDVFLIFTNRRGQHNFSYLVGPGFHSRSRYRLYCLSSFVAFLKIYSQMSGYCLNLGLLFCYAKPKPVSYWPEDGLR